MGWVWKCVMKKAENDAIGTVLRINAVRVRGEELVDNGLRQARMPHCDVANVSVG